jgi:hypothetical protein
MGAGLACDERAQHPCYSPAQARNGGGRALSVQERADKAGTRAQDEFVPVDQVVVESTDVSPSRTRLRRPAGTIRARASPGSSARKTLTGPPIQAWSGECPSAASPARYGTARVRPDPATANRLPCVRRCVRPAGHERPPTGATDVGPAQGGGPRGEGGGEGQRGGQVFVGEPVVFGQPDRVDPEHLRLRA